MGLFHVLLLSLAISHGVDVATTLHCPRPLVCREQNPFVLDPYQHPVEFTAQVAVYTTTELLLLEWLHRDHPKLATGLTLTMISVEGWAAVHNIRDRR